MFLKRSIVLFFFFLLRINCLPAQQIVGCWEGDMGGTEFLQMNIIQVGDRLCGYTWDHMWSNKRDYCKAYFTGTYDKINKTWFLDGTSFMENSGSHVLMQLKCWITYENGEPVLKGYSVIKSMLSTLFGAGSPNMIRLEKVSSRPALMTQTMKDCMKEFEPKKDTVVKVVPVVPKKKDTVVKIVPVIPKKKDSIIIPPVIEKKKDTVIVPPVVKLPPKENPLPTQMSNRKNKEMSRIEVNERNLTLNVYDNATIDGDTVSIFYNGRLIMSHQRLSQKPIVIDLVLDENTRLHNIVLFAENLGSIPPNTALIIVTTPSGKRYELFSSATLEQNAVLVFEYKPG